mgnify:CR=1 FL=1
MEKARTVREMPENLRPRELVERLGVRGVQDDILLALILRSGIRGRNVVELARDLLNIYGGLEKLANTTAGELANKINGLGKVKAQVIAAALELGRRMMMESRQSKCKISIPADVNNLMLPYTAGLEKEVFWVLHLDTKNNLKRPPEEISSGVLDAAIVHPREVFREAIRIAAASVILVHNHPSGDSSPSQEDLQITKQLVEAGRIIDIRVLDHIIIGNKDKDGQGRGGFTSFHESGLVEFWK